MADATVNWVSWTQRLRASDAGALEELMQAMHVPLLRYTTGLVADRDTAYDILQEAFIKLWGVRGTLDPERSLKALLYRMVYTRALNHNRMKRRESEAHAVVGEGLQAHQPARVDEEMDARRLGELMNQWISEMPARRQEAFRLSRFEGLSHQEISTVMDLSVQTVTKHIMLALQFLRDRFSAHQKMGQAS